MNTVYAVVYLSYSIGKGYRRRISPTHDPDGTRTLAQTLIVIPTTAVRCVFCSLTKGCPLREVLKKFVYPSAVPTTRRRLLYCTVPPTASQRHVHLKRGSTFVPEDRPPLLLHRLLCSHHAFAVVRFGEKKRDEPGKQRTVPWHDNKYCIHQ